jgi:hypothetical protein
MTDKLDAKFRAHYEFGDRRELVTSARTYFYEDEHVCDENLNHFIQGIDAVSGKDTLPLSVKDVLRTLFNVFVSKFYFNSDERSAFRNFW